MKIWLLYFWDWFKRAFLGNVEEVFSTNIGFIDRECDDFEGDFDISEGEAIYFCDCHWSGSWRKDYAYIYGDLTLYEGKGWMARRPVLGEPPSFPGWEKLFEPECSSSCL